MKTLNTEQKELRHVLQDIKARGEGCTICKFLKIFAFVVLVLTVVFVVFVRLDKESTNQPLPAELAPKITPQTYYQHVLELGAAMHPAATATPNVTPQGTTGSGAQVPPPSYVPRKNQ